MSAHLRSCYILGFSTFHFHILELRHSQSQYLISDVSAFHEKKHVQCQLLKHLDGKAKHIKHSGQTMYVLFLVLQRVVCHQSESITIK